MGIFLDSVFDNLRNFFIDSNNLLRDLLGPTKSVIGLTIVLSIIFIILGWRIKKLKIDKKTPLLYAPILAFVNMMNKFSKENFGRHWKFYSPYFLALSIYIFISNTCDLFGMSNPTSYLVNTIALAFMSFLIIQITGIVSNGPKASVKALFEPNPILFPMNVIGEFSFPISLGLRIFGNILSSVFISTLIISALRYFAIPVLPVISLVFSIGFGLIQTTVFVLLTMIFTANKINENDLIY